MRRAVGKWMPRTSKDGWPRDDRADRGAMRRKAARAESEKEFERRVVECAAKHGWIGYHTPDSRACSCPGFPDWVFAHFERRKIIVAELKRERGQPSLEQYLWLKTMQFAGIDARLWRPSDWDEIEKTFAIKEGKKDDNKV